MAISTDHSPIFLSVAKKQNNSKGNDFWKFDNSLMKDQ